EAVAAIEEPAAGAGLESAAVDPDQHRALRGAAGGRRPHVEGEAVLRHAGLLSADGAADPRRRLERPRPEGIGPPRPGPRLGWAGGPEPQLAHRRGGERDPVEPFDPVLGRPS